MRTPGASERSAASRIGPHAVGRRYPPPTDPARVGPFPVLSDHGRARGSARSHGTLSAPRLRCRNGSGLPPRHRKPRTDDAVEGEVARSGQEEQREDREVGQRQLFHGEQIAVVDDQKRHSHREDHGDQRQAVEGPGHDAGSTEHLGEDRQREHRAAPQPDRIGKRGGEGLEMAPLVYAVRHEQQAEDDPRREQQPRGVDSVADRGVEKSKNLIHKSRFTSHGQSRCRNPRPTRSEYEYDRSS